MRYDYKCSNCNKIIEITHSMKDKEKRFCKFCGGELERQISKPTIVFKGSGFFCTDNVKTNIKR